MRLTKKDLFPLSVIGGVQFIILTFIAMITYKGGTRLDPTSKGYSFFSNFFSDLGRTISYSGEVNTVSAVIFFVALIGLGLSFLGYFLIIPEVFTETDEGIKYSNIVSIIGKCSVVAFIGVAFAPADILPFIHDILVIIGFTLIAIVSGSAFILTAKDSRFTRKSNIVFLFLFVVVLCYGSLSLFIPTIITHIHLIIRATAQKIVIYTMILSFLFQNYDAWKIIKNKKDLGIESK